MSSEYPREHRVLKLFLNKTFKDIDKNLVMIVIVTCGVISFPKKSFVYLLFFRKSQNTILKQMSWIHG